MGNTEVRIPSDLPTVSVGIPAYNEARSIGRLLLQLLNQKQVGFRLSRIVVINDGSTDGTYQAVKDVASGHPVVSLIHRPQRKGKSARTNELFRSAQADLLVLVDADILLHDRLALSRLVTLFQDRSVGIASGALHPFRSRRLVGQAVAVYEQFWSRVTERIQNGRNVHHCLGCVIAIRKPLYQHVTIPIRLVAQDHYLYFKALGLGYSFAWTKPTLAYFKTPNTLRDYIRQGARFDRSRDDLSFYLPKIPKDAYRVPVMLKFRTYLSTLITHPILLSIALFLQIARLAMASFAAPTQNTAIWPAIQSTK